MCYKYTWIIPFSLESGITQLILVHLVFDTFVLLPDITIRTLSPSLVSFLNNTVEKKVSPLLSVRNALTVDLKHTKLFKSLFKTVKTLCNKINSTILFHLSFH